MFSEHKYIIIDGDKAKIFEVMFETFYLTTDFYELKTIIKNNFSFIDSKAKNIEDMLKFIENII